MRHCLGMEKKRMSNKRHVWYMVGLVTDRMIRDMKELARLEKLERAGGAPGSTPPVPDAPEQGGKARRDGD